MAELSLRDVCLAFGAAPLLDRVSLQVEAGERICLLGRNGAGKSSLLRLLAGEIPPDSGIIDRRQGLRAATLPQDVPREMAGSVFEVVAGGLGAAGDGLCRYHELSRQLAESGDQGLLPDLLAAQKTLEDGGGWELQQRTEQIVDRLKLPADAPMASLSGGVKRRVLLARALVADPDLLLLDEPTNHLEIESIAWLEDFLRRSRTALVFVTHDRAFLRTLATRIVEIDRGRVFDFACDYDTFLVRKEELLHAEAQEWARFDKKLAQEEVWIRQGIKARRTRNEGRVRALKAMREERRQRRERSGTAKLQLLEAERSGKLVAELTDVSFAYGEKPIVRDLSTTILRGDRVGIIGPNGAGKTTLLKLLLGELAPQQGTVRLGSNLQVLYFDQLREQLDPDRTVQQNLSGDQDTIMIGGQPRHVIGYLQDFLFTPERARTPVRILSGGERSRLLLARLFAREANVLVLDEPTNDLDLETLDLLEELLADFGGTVFLVSHDRDFLNRIVSGTLVFAGEGRVEEYVGGYDDWLRQRPQPTAAVPVAKTVREKPAKERPRKLTFKERQELAELPQRIEALETEQAQLHAQSADPAFYRAGGEQVAALRERLGALEADLEAAYARWAELDALEA
jgi:ATP-binding cassette subfamily F protein uup